MIRLARPEDRNRVVELLRDSRVGAGFDPAGRSGFTFPFDPAYAARLFVQHTTSPHAACFIHDVGGVPQGVLMMVAFDHPYGPVRVSKDSMWWIDPAHRGGTAAVRMLDAAEAWSAAQGCAFSGIAGMGDDPAVGVLLRRRGYAPAEVHYLKPLRSAA
jgi:hypothetical protein